MSRSPTTLVLAVVQPEDAPALLGALTHAGCGATYLAARGGFLNRHAVAVLVLTPAERLTTVLHAVQATCSRRMALVTPVAEAEFGFVPEPLEVEIGGAVIFGLPVASTGLWGALDVPTTATRRPFLFDSARAMAPGLVTTSPAPAEETLMLDPEPTKLIVAVVPDRVASRVVMALVERHFGATTIGSTGGFLRRGNTTILTGVPAEQAEEAAHLIQTACRAGGEGESPATGIAFALDVAWRLRL